MQYQDKYTFFVTLGKRAKAEQEVVTAIKMLSFSLIAIKTDILDIEDVTVKSKEEIECFC